MKDTQYRIYYDNVLWISFEDAFSIFIYAYFRNLHSPSAMLQWLFFCFTIFSTSEHDISGILIHSQLLLVIWLPCDPCSSLTSSRALYAIIYWQSLQPYIQTMYLLIPFWHLFTNSKFFSLVLLSCNLPIGILQIHPAVLHSLACYFWMTGYTNPSHFTTNIR